MHRHLVLLLAVAAGGCAFSDVPLTMPVGGLETPISGGNGRQVVVSIPFTDLRDTKERCGVQKNGYKQVTADAQCMTDPADWLGTLLASELRASGFRVVDSAEATPSTLRIEGEVLKVFVEPIIGTWSGSLEADLEVRLAVSSGNGLKADRAFYVKGVKKGVMASTLTPYHTALNRATDELLKEMVTAVFEILDDYPQLGAHRQPRRGGVG